MIKKFKPFFPLIKEPLHAVATSVTTGRSNENDSKLVEVLTQYSKRALHKLRQLEAVAAATKRLDKNEQWRPHEEPKPRYRLADRFDSETLNRIVARYEAGEPTTTLAAEYGAAKSSLLRLLEVRGVAMRNQRLTPSQEQQILQLRRRGTAIRTIAGKVGCSYGTAQAFLKAQSDGMSR